MSLPTITLPNLDLLLTLAHGDIEAAHEAALFLNVDFWGDQEDEQYTETDLDAYLEMALDRCAPIPESLKVTGYRRMRLEPGEPDPDAALERIYEDLDDEYNGGDDASEPSDAVKEAAASLCDLIRREYVPWNCEPAVTITLDAADIQRKLAEFWPDEYGPAGRA